MSDSFQWAETLVQLLALKPNWDSYDALEIDRRAVVAAFDLGVRFVREGFPSPWIVPVCRGSVQLEWTNKSRSLEVEIDPDGQHIVCLWDGGYAAENAEISDPLTLTEALPLIRERLMALKENSPCSR